MVDVGSHHIGVGRLKEVLNHIDGFRYRRTGRRALRWKFLRRRRRRGNSRERGRAWRWRRRMSMAFARPTQGVTMRVSALGKGRKIRGRRRDRGVTSEDSEGVSEWGRGRRGQRDRQGSR